MFIKVRVFPDSKQEEIIEKSKDNFEIRVKERASQGKANKKVLEVLVNFLKITKSGIRLIKGRKQRNKIFEVKEDI